MKQYAKLFILALALIAASCRDGTQNNTEKTEAASAKGAAKVKLQVDALQDSLNRSWQVMTEGDDRKMASVKRLLDEISYTPRYNVLQQKRLLKAYERVKPMRYTRQSMAESAAIDRYDAAQDSLVRSTQELALNTPTLETHPIAEELAADIQQEQNMIIVHRIRHDGFARELNALIRKNERKLKKLGEPYASLKPQPLFDLTGK